MHFTAQVTTDRKILRAGRRQRCTSVASFCDVTFPEFASGFFLDFIFHRLARVIVIFETYCILTNCSPAWNFQMTKSTVHIHELTTWAKDSATPAAIDDLLELICLVENCERRQRKRLTLKSAADIIDRSHLVAVVCLDGATRSGLYAATSLAIDRMNCDDELDVFLSCRYITNARPQAISSAQQYEYVYLAAVTSLTQKPSRPVDGNGRSSTNGDALYINVDIGAGAQQDGGTVIFESDIYDNTSRVGYAAGTSTDNDYRLYENFTK